VRSNFASLTVLFGLLILSVSGTARAQCRDASGEPAACTVAPVVTPLSGPTPVAPLVEPEPEEPNQTGHTHRETEVAYVDFALTAEAIDTRQLHFSPMTPRSVPAMARGSVALGVGTPFENATGGLTFALGIRPTPWLRFPQLRLSAGFGDFDGATVDMLGGSQPLRATFHDFSYLRAELGAGVDFDLDPIRFYALGHVAIAGYFASATIEHGTLGDLGTETFAEDVWELGWTVGLEIEILPEVAYTVSYRHVHTGVESNAVMFGLNVRLH
jgi:hypothetical protein